MIGSITILAPCLVQGKKYDPTRTSETGRCLQEPLCCPTIAEPDVAGGRAIGMDQHRGKEFSMVKSSGRWFTRLLKPALPLDILVIG